MADLYWPLPVSQVTEWPASPGRPNHWGTDFGCAVGTPMRATSNGTITYVGDDGLGGMTVDLTRADGLLQRYGHLSRYNCRVGQVVKAGDVIAWSGNTGMSTGPHLHWELRWDRAWSGGRWVDPRTLNPAVFGSDSNGKNGDGEMLMIHKAGTNPTLFAVFGPKFWLEFTGQDVANGFAAQIGSSSVQVTPQFWDYCKKAAGQ